MAQPNKEIQQLIRKLEDAVKFLNSGSKDQVKVNRELLKVISLLESGFAKNRSDAEELVEKVKSGLDVTDEVAEKWAKQRGATKKDLETIVSKFRQLEKIYGQVGDRADDFKDTLEDVGEYLDDEIDLTKNLFKTYEDINKVLKKSRDAVGQIGTGTMTVDSVMNQILKKKGTISSMFDDAFSSVSMVDDVLQKMKTDTSALANSISGLTGDVELNFQVNSTELDTALKEVQGAIQLENDARLAGLLQYFSKNEELQTKLSRKFAAEELGGSIKFDINTNIIEDATGKLEEGTAAYNHALRELDSTALKTDSIAKARDLFLEIGNLINKGVLRTEEENNALDSLVSKLDIASQMIADQVKTRQQELTLMLHQIALEKNKQSALTKYTKHLQIAENAVLKIGDAFDYVNGLLPAGIGNLIGLQKVSYQLTDAHRKGAEALTGAIGQGASKAEALSAYAKAFGGNIKLAITPATAIVAVIAMAYKFVEGMVDQYKEMSKEMGLSLKQSQKLYESDLELVSSKRNQFETTQEILEAQKEMIGQSGRIYDLTSKANQEVTLNAIEMGKAFGYGTETAVKLQKQFEILGADKEFSSRLQGDLGLLSEMVGLSPQIIAQDLIDSSEEVYTYFAGMPAKAAKAAIEVRKMGLSLKQAGSIAQKMLNLEGFMTDMYELRAMTGPNGIDFSEAFDKGLMGDIEGMTKSIMKQIGSTAELNNMDYLTRTKIANTLGISNEELGKSVANYEKMSQLSPELQKSAEEYGNRIGDISHMSQDQIKNRIAELQSTDRLGVAWDKIKATFVKALLPLVETFGNLLEGLGPVIDLLIPVLQGLMWPFQQIIKLINLISPILKPVWTILQSITSVSTNFFKNLLGIKDTTEGIIDPVKGIAAAFSSWFILKKIMGWFGMIGTTSKGISSSIGVIGKMFGGLFGVFGKVFKGILSHLPVIGIAFRNLFKKIDKQADESNSKIVGGSKRSFGKIAGMAGMIFAAVDSKLIFGSIQQIAARAFGKMGLDGVETFLGIGKQADETLGSIEESGTSALSNIGSIGSTLLFGYLSSGLEGFIEKKFSKAFEDKTDTMVKKVSKKFSKLGEPLIDVPEKAAGPLTKFIEKLSTPLKPLKDKFTSIFDSVGKKAEESGGLIGKIFAKIKPKGIEETIQKTNITEKVQTLIPKRVKPKDLVETVTQQTETEIRPPKGAEKTISLYEKIKNTILTGFKDIGQVLQTALKSVKKVLIELTDLIGGVLKSLGGSIGKTMQLILKGIGDGLSSFKTTAITGAATLVILSGALWIASKAIQNFVSVKWEDLAKAGAALGGLAVVAMILGTASAQMILGAVAIGLLGASLIPAAIGLQKFADVKWSDLAKAGVTIVGLGVAAGILGAMFPIMALGTVILIGFGAALVTMGAGALLMAKSLNIAAPALERILKSINGVITTIGQAISGVIVSIGQSFKQVSFSIKELASINPIKLFAVAQGIVSIGAALMTFTALNAASKVTDAFFNILGKGPIGKLQELADMANPLQTVAIAIGMMTSELKNFSEVLQGLKLDQIDVLKGISEIHSEKFAPIRAEIATRTPEEIPGEAPENLNVRPDFRRTRIKIQEPARESTAQNVQIKDLTRVKAQVKQQENEEKEQEQQYGSRLNNTTDRESILTLRRIEKLLAVIANKDLTVELDGIAVNKRLKKYNNNL